MAHPSPLWVMFFFSFLGAVAIATGAASGLGAPVTDDDVAIAIERLQQYLYAQQDRAHGTWERDGGLAAPQSGGVTGLVVSALLISGESPQNPPLAQAIELLSKADLSGTYERAVRAHVWALLPDSHRSLLERDALWLLNAHDGSSRFRYTRQPTSYDHSATQYAMLGLWEAAKRGVKAPRAFWRDAQSHFLQVQNADGGWGYTGDSESKTSMTAAGLTALLITQQQLHAQLAKVQPKPAEAIKRGLTWLDDHFDGTRNLTASGRDARHRFYTLYSIERVALANGVKYFGRRDWFQAGARFILDQQVLGDDPNTFGRVGKSLISSAFSLMFLSRGRVQTWVTKLALPNQPWNNRPNDVNHLTYYLSDLREAEINWQMVDLNMPAEALLNAPVAYLASNQALRLTEHQVANLKRYIDMGGMLLACAESGSHEFGQSIRDLAKHLYPQWELERLPADHRIFRALYAVPGGREIQGVSNGARDLIIFVRRDWGYVFQANRRPGRSRDWKVAANLYTLATNRGHWPPRLERPFPKRKVRLPTATLAVGRARCASADHRIVEPGAWRAMSNHLINRTGIELEVTDMDLADIATRQPALVHLAGVKSVQLNGAELAAIRQYAEKGGILLVETVGGNGDFTVIIEKQLNRLFASGAVTLSSKSAIIDGRTMIGGYDNRTIAYRRYAPTATAVGERSRLAAYHVNERPAVIVSREDLSLGMLGVRHWGICGYKPESARRLVSNILLRAVQ